MRWAAIAAFALGFVARLGADALAANGERGRDARVRIDVLCAERAARARGAQPERFARIYDAASTHPRWHVADARTLL